MLGHGTALTPAIRKCIDECLDCEGICLETIAHCLQMGGRHAEPEHIAVLRDCATMWEASAKFMLHGSRFPLYYPTGSCRGVGDLT